MANNKEAYCTVCNSYETFFLESDMLWYCDECGRVEGTKSKFRDEESFQEALEEFEDRYGEAIFCKSCNNFNALEGVVLEGVCGECFNELDESDFEEIGYVYCEESGIYYKETDEDAEEETEEDNEED